MNYIGSKLSLLPHIDHILNRHNVPKSGIAVDLFSGTGSVAKLLKRRGHITYANDWQRYAYMISRATIHLNRLPEFETLFGQIGHQLAVFNGDTPAQTVLNYLNDLTGKPGPFFHIYCEGGNHQRQYFSEKNGLKIQAIRNKIRRWRDLKWISTLESQWLIACLICAADAVANTASVYGAYLKHIKTAAKKDLQLKLLAPIQSKADESSHQIYCRDSINLAKALKPQATTLTYIDPPYNHRQYSANYHILETIARWDLHRFEPRGKTGLRNANRQKSKFCIRAEAPSAFNRLIKNIQSDYVLLSYNNEGILTPDTLCRLIDRWCITLDVIRIPYTRYKADQNHENRTYASDSVDELLILAQPRQKI